MSRARAPAVVLLAAATLAPGAAWAHTFLPAVVEVRLAARGEHEMRLRPPQLPPGDERRFEPRVGAPCTQQRAGIVWRVRCDARVLASAPIRLVVVAGDRALPMPELFVDLRWPDGRRELAVAGGAVDSAGVAAARPGRTRTVVLGIVHILSGIDHLLFVIGLCALGGGLRRLIPTVTSFTVGHSLTLAAIAFGLFRPAQAPIEILVALTLLFLARALAGGRAGGDAGPRLAFVFGLVHGGAFAGALADLGLQAGGAAATIFCFNLGVELGQIAVVVAATALAATARALAPALATPRTGRLLAAYALGVVAVVLVLERVPLLTQG